MEERMVAMPLFDLAVGGFLSLHGLVHLWYVVLSQGWVELEDAMGWTGHSWLLSGSLPQETILLVASALYVVVTVGFVGGAVGIVLETTWATPVLIISAMLSTVVIVAMWNGTVELLVEQGVVGVLINLGIVAALLWF
jgi:hypothetical protein